jgi:hypothetical protein
VVRALADMVGRTGEGQADMVKAVAKALNLSAPQDHGRLVPALLLLQHVPEDYASVPGAVSGLIGSLLLQVFHKERCFHQCTRTRTRTRTRSRDWIRPKLKQLESRFVAAW